MFFSQQFGVSAIQMRVLGVFNPELSSDNRLFIDPKLLEASEGEFVSSDVDLIEYFRKVVVLLRASKKTEDNAWVAARNRMIFKETSNTALGFSKEGTNGRGIGKTLAGRIVTRAQEILPEVNFDPELLELIGVFGEDIACDRLSDMFVSILKKRFLDYTDRVTRELNVQRASIFTYEGVSYTCPRFDLKSKPLILVPRSLLKPLPIALDLAQALDNADLAASVRAEVNALWAAAAKKKRNPTKGEIKALINSKPKIYKSILDGYRKATSSPYDFDNDPKSVSDYEAIAAEVAGEPNLSRTGKSPQERVLLTVRETLSHLRKSFEQHRLSDCLYSDSGEPRNEVIAQRLLLTVGRLFGRLLDVAVTRESNIGVGAVDFHFSVGNSAKAILELKLSTHNRLEDGYFIQLPIYGAAEDVTDLYYLVLQVDDGTKLRKLKEKIDREKPTGIKLEIIDATKKPSASKQKNK